MSAYKTHHRPHRIHTSVYWDRVALMFGLPLIAICLLISIAFKVEFEYASYQESKRIEKEQKEQLEKMELEELTRKQEQEQMQHEIELKKEQSRIETLRNVQECRVIFDTKLAKKTCPIGTYVEDTNEHLIGQVNKIYGLCIYTDNDWAFTLLDTGELPNHITYLSYREYKSKGGCKNGNKNGNKNGSKNDG